MKHFYLILKTGGLADLPVLLLFIQP